MARVRNRMLTYTGWGGPALTGGSGTKRIRPLFASSMITILNTLSSTPPGISWFGAAEVSWEDQCGEPLD